MASLSRLYADVSGASGSRIICAAACLASEEQWRKFERAWAAILRDAEVEYFHATDFFSCRGEFKEWEQNSDRQKSFCDRFARAIAKYVRYGHAFGVDADKFEEHLGRPLADVQRTPYNRMRADTYATAVALGRVVGLALEDGQGAPAIILEDGPGVGETIEYLNFLKRNDPLMAAVPSITSMPKSARPLQAADFMAHEAWRFLKDQLAGTNRPRRKPLDILFANAKGVLTVEIATEKNYRVSREQNRRLAEQNPRLAVKPHRPAPSK